MLHLLSVLAFATAGIGALIVIAATILEHYENIMRALRRQPAIPDLPAPVPPRIRVLQRKQLAATLPPLRAAA